LNRSGESLLPCLIAYRGRTIFKHYR
jgi:hypothetical protein